MAKPFYVEWAPVFSGALFAVGLGMLAAGAISLMGIMLKDLGAWAYWVMFIGFFVFLSGLIWLGMYLSSVRRFRKLAAEKSKAVFVKNMDDVEYLAWKLPMKYERQLVEKKRDLGIR